MRSASRKWRLPASERESVLIAVVTVALTHPNLRPFSTPVRIHAPSYIDKYTTATNFLLPLTFFWHDLESNSLGTPYMSLLGFGSLFFRTGVQSQPRF